mmetsp:Transcript_73624/g.227482  ORF Transcript_73624/g.227482 Transcript_73624/m.227482 type:complete len:240 (-) Transcript_73624:237-956(-)
MVNGVLPRQALATGGADGGGGIVTGGGGGGTDGGAVGASWLAKGWKEPEASKPKGEGAWQIRPCGDSPPPRPLPGSGGTASKFGQLLGMAAEVSQHPASYPVQAAGTVATTWSQAAACGLLAGIAGGGGSESPAAGEGRKSDSRSSVEDAPCDCAAGCAPGAAVPQRAKPAVMLDAPRCTVHGVETPGEASGVRKRSTARAACSGAKFEGTDFGGVFTDSVFTGDPKWMKVCFTSNSHR